MSVFAIGRMGMYGLAGGTFPSSVMAGFMPATHEHGLSRQTQCAWVPGTSPGKTG